MGHCLLRCPYNPHAYYVCGTDGVTYNSECELKRKACVEAMKGNPIALAYSGRCRQHGHCE
ncbi:hypothetical protein E2C01_096697 [Portunus trituberculatus]|uniref:Kazal-like domain-containing protein n=1 Tax=Portunus trituberculatus TaxID=210409 RepID=A0A5B7K7X4_PORTR|nr:hypothetical protein [Portunus trituberculatus]